MYKGGNTNTLKLKFWQNLWDDWSSVTFNIKFCFGLVHFKQKFNFDYYSRKIITSLAHIFTMEKALFKIIFWIKFLFVNRFSKFLRHNLRLLELRLLEFKRVTQPYFAGGVSEK